jgi:hypothetical protein
MKGFVIELRKAKNEDSIATVLSSHEVRTYYRFFGARHSILQLGNLIDFEVEGEHSGFMPRLRSLSHIGFPWLYDNNRLLHWHNYIRLIAAHLRDTHEVSPFYFDLLLGAARKWDKQNPKRIICESYITQLDFEGRLHNEDLCYICEESLGETVSLMQAFIPAHPHCIDSISMNKQKIFSLFAGKKTIYLDDDEVEYLHEIIQRGL